LEVVEWLSPTKPLPVAIVEVDLLLQPGNRNFISPRGSPMNPDVAQTAVRPAVALKVVEAGPEAAARAKCLAQPAAPVAKKRRSPSSPAVIAPSIATTASSLSPAPVALAAAVVAVDTVVVAAAAVVVATAAAAAVAATTVAAVAAAATAAAVAAVAAAVAAVAAGNPGDTVAITPR
jgi:hypothetical protein